MSSNGGRGALVGNFSASPILRGISFRCWHGMAIYDGESTTIERFVPKRAAGKFADPSTGARRTTTANALFVGVVIDLLRDRSPVCRGGWLLRVLAAEVWRTAVMGATQIDRSFHDATSSRSSAVTT